MIKLTPPIVFHFVVFVLFTTSTSAQLYPVKVNGKWGMIDSTGQLKIKPIYDGIGEIKSWNYAIVQLEDKIGLLDADGKTLLSANYEQIKVIQKNVFSVKKKGVVLLINDKEKVLIANFDDLLALDEDRIAFEQQKKWGVVATNGNILLRPAYDAIAKYNEVFITQLNNKFGLASGLGEPNVVPRHAQLPLFRLQYSCCNLPSAVRPLPAVEIAAPVPTSCSNGSGILPLLFPGAPRCCCFSAACYNIR